MKKISITLISAFISLVAYNQESKLAIGIEGGPSIIRLAGNSIVNSYDNRISYQVGLALEYIINERISLKSGIGYERKGTGTSIQMYDNNGWEAGTQSVKINYDYLTLPVLISYSTTGKIRFYVNAGPYLAYLISCEEIYEPTSVISGTSFDRSDETKKIDLGVSLGFGFTFRITEFLLFDIGTRENFGVINTSNVEVIDDKSIRTVSLDLLLGLKYKF